MTFRFAFLLILQWALLSSGALAGPKKVFLRLVDGERAYQADLASLQKGDTIIFEDGRQSVFEGWLGRGGLSRVYASGDGFAVKLPGSVDVCCQGNLAIVQHYQEFKNTGVNIVRVEPITEDVTKPGSSPLGHYVMEERLPVRYKLDDFITAIEAGKMRPETFRSVYGPALREFAESLAAWRAIDDLKPDQVGWDDNTRKFVLLDWRDGGLRAISIEDESPFWNNYNSKKYSYQHFNLPEGMKEELEEVVRAKRRALGMRGALKAPEFPAGSPGVPRISPGSPTQPEACPNGLRAKIRAIPGLPTVRGH